MFYPSNLSFFFSVYPSDCVTVDLDPGGPNLEGWVESPKTPVFVTYN